MTNLFIFGLGYSASAVASLVRAEGYTVAGTVRAREKLKAMETGGISPVLFDDRKAVEAALATATHLLISAPPSDEGDPSLLAYHDAMRAGRDLTWIGYLSTIGVYGNHDGAWIDESAAPAAASGRGGARIRAEAAWTDFAKSGRLPLDIFRLSGIYGPGRSPLDRVRDGTARRIIKPGQVFNRIHVEDIAHVVTTAIKQPGSAGDVRLFNVTDDEPAPPQDVVLFAASLLGVAPPPEVPFEAADLSPMARSFYEDNKRVRNGRMKQDLGVQLRYPTYREGLRSLLTPREATIALPKA